MKVLLLAPLYLDLYKDVINELENQGYSVDFIPDKSFRLDPYLVRNLQCRWWSIWIYELFLWLYWKFYNIKKAKYDFFFVINGMSCNSSLIRTIKKQNPQTKTILYLWDRTYQNYRFDRHFKYFDRVVTFDKIDSIKYNIDFLPNYWIPMGKEYKQKYKVFAFGGYREDRYNLYKQIKDICGTEYKNIYVYIFVRPICKNLKWKIKRLLKMIFRKEMSLIEDQIADKKIIARIPLSPTKFREKIYESDCIIDTNNDFQEGLTPRFMWALGAGKKIITTNVGVRNYDFFDESLIYIVDKGKIDKTKILSFLSCSSYFVNQKSILRYRIDNWLKFLLESEDS